MRFIFFILFLFYSFNVYSASEGKERPKHKWSFNGITGTFDKSAIQRGYKVYREVCAGCHGLKHVAYRNLGDKGGPELPPEQVKAYAAQFDIYDPDIDDDRSAEYMKPLANQRHLKWLGFVFWHVRLRWTRQNG